MALRDSILAESSLRHYWDLGEASGTTAADSKKGADGTLDRPLTVSGTVTVGATGIDASNPSATAFTFGGGKARTADFVPHFNGAEASWWVFFVTELTSISGSVPFFMDIFRQFASLNVAQIRHFADGKIYAEIDGGTSAAQSATGVLTTSTRYTVLVQYNASDNSLKIYVNGSTTAVATGGSTSSLTDDPWVTVGAADDGSAPMAGKMQHVATGASVLTLSTYTDWDTLARTGSGLTRITATRQVRYEVQSLLTRITASRQVRYAVQSNSAALWAQDAHDPQRSGHTAITPSAPWTYLWAWNGPDKDGGNGGVEYVVPPEARPVVGADAVFAPVGDAGVVALDRDTGAVLWRYRAEGVACAPAYDLATDRLFICTAQGNVTKLNAATGAVIGRFYAGGGNPLRKAPLLVGADLYVVNDSGGLYKLAIGAAGAALSQTWLYAGGASAGQPADTPAAYSAVAGKVVYATRDLFVHAVVASSGAASWRVKPTTNSPTAEITFDGGWPVVAEQHGVVFVRLQLPQSDLNAWPTDGGRYPTGGAAAAGAEIRTWLDANPARKSLFAMQLTDGASAFTPAVGYGSVEGARGAITFGELNQLPVVKVWPNGDEVVYVCFRNGTQALANGWDFRWDGQLGEMVLDTTTVAGLAAGDLRFVQGIAGSFIIIIDEQCPLVGAGDAILFAHWGASEGLVIADRADARGLTNADPITVTALPFVVRQTQPAGTKDVGTHHTTSGMNQFEDTRFYSAGGFWFIWNAQEPPGHVNATTYSAGARARYTFVAGEHLFVVGNGGGIMCLRHSSADYARPAATALTLTGPSSGRAAVASDQFVVALSPAGASHAGVVVTLSDGGAGGTFSANNFTLTTQNARRVFTYTPEAPDAGSTVTITVTNDGGLTNP
jgi:hypothetical protein